MEKKSLCRKLNSRQSGEAEDEKFKCQTAWLGGGWLPGIASKVLVVTVWTGRRELNQAGGVQHFCQSREDCGSPPEVAESRSKPPACPDRARPQTKLAHFCCVFVVVRASFDRDAEAWMDLYRLSNSLITLSWLCLWSWLLLKMGDKNVLALTLTKPKITFYLSFWFSKMALKQHGWLSFPGFKAWLDKLCSALHLLFLKRPNSVNAADETWQRFTGLVQLWFSETSTPSSLCDCGVCDRKRLLGWSSTMKISTCSSGFLQPWSTLNLLEMNHLSQIPRQL